MFNDLLDAISIKLNLVFGNGYKIYADKDVNQGLTEPCFFIAILNPSQTQIVGSRYSRKFPVDIHYFPLKDGDNVELMTVADKLMVEMETVKLVNNDLVRGSDVHSEIIDGVLHFFINYRMIVLISDTPADEMENLTVSQTLER